MAEARRRTGSLPPPPAASRGLCVLIVEDEPALLTALRINLRARGYDVVTAAAGREAVSLAARRKPDAILLDLGLPDLDGTQVIRELRARSQAPVIVISGRGGSGDKIGALDAGASDYVTKPFNMAALLARLRAVLRHGDYVPDRARFILGRHEIDLAACTVVRSARSGPSAGSPPAAHDPGSTRQAAGRSAGTRRTADQEEVHLTPTEWRLLEILLHAPGQLVSSGRLMDEIWGPELGRSTHHLRFHMARLRHKLEDDPPRPRHLLTEPGLGYRYQP